MLESVIKKGKKHYPQTDLEECKYEIKKKKMTILIQIHQMNLIMNLIMKNLMINSLMINLKIILNIVNMNN